MLRREEIIAGLALVIAVAACQQPAPTGLTDADKDAVRAQIEKYRQAVLAADWPAWGNTLASDVFYSPPNMTPIRGRDAAVAWANTLPKFISFTVQLDDISGSGDIAYVRGTYSYEVELPDGTHAADEGTFLDVHRRAADRTWPYTNVLWHSNLAAPTSPAAPPQGATR